MCWTERTQRSVHAVSIVRTSCEKPGSYWHNGSTREDGRSSGEKPLLCDLRPKGHFAIGSEIVFYLSPYYPYYIVTDPARLFAGRIGTLLAGRVIDEYNYSVQSIVIKTDTPFHIREDNQLSGVTEVSIERPEVIHQDEYEYLRSHPEFLYQWAHYAQESHRSFDSSGFVKAVEKGV